MERIEQFDSVQDPFNTNNFLTGEINKTEGSKYGQRRLTHINRMKCVEQIIYCTPKIHYPFNRFGKFYYRNTPEVSPVYEKYDGTNIVGYQYIYRKKVFVTYKTRLRPVLGTSRYGDFVGLWKEMLEKYPHIPDIIKKYDVNLSFELYGVLNKLLIIYPFRLDLILIFALDRFTGQIELPDRFQDYFPTAKVYYNIKPQHDFPSFYKRIAGEIESTNVVISKDEIKGSEGAVVYVREENQWKQWKLKPETIFGIHTAPGLNQISIRTTVYNALENTSIQDLTYSIVVDLLEEEFQPRDIIDRKTLILKIIEEVKGEILDRHKSIDLYKKFGVSILQDKVQVMQFLSQHFEKGKMRYIYTILKAYEGEK